MYTRFRAEALSDYQEQQAADDAAVAATNAALLH